MHVGLRGIPGIKTFATGGTEGRSVKHRSGCPLIRTSASSLLLRRFLTSGYFPLGSSLRDCVTGLRRKRELQMKKNSPAFWRVNTDASEIYSENLNQDGEV